VSDDLYQAVIVDHDRAPRNQRPLPGATHVATIDNPLCGDIVTVRLVIDDATIRDVAFECRGCALARAAASIMSTRVAGLTATAATALAARFERFVAEPVEAPVAEGLGELTAFRGVRRVRSRRTCATLPFRALVAALAGDG